MCEEACEPLMIFKSVSNNKSAVALCGVRELVWPDVRAAESLVNNRILMFGSYRMLSCYSERVRVQGPVNSETLLKSWNS